MWSKAIARIFLAANAVSFAAVTTLLVVIAALYRPASAQEGGMLLLRLLAALIINVILHGTIALLGAFLAELERIRVAVEGITRAAQLGTSQLWTPRQ